MNQDLVLVLRAHEEHNWIGSFGAVVLNLEGEIACHEEVATDPKSSTIKGVVARQEISVVPLNGRLPISL